MDLCGHATLAAAHIIKSELNSADEIKFKTLSGDLSVNFKEDLYYLNLPSRKPVNAKLPHEIKSALNIQPNFILKSIDYLLVYNNEQDIKALKERDIVVLVDTNPSIPSLLRKKLRPHGFAFILIGKDGQVKLRKPSPWNIREIARVIDKMPIRQQEITRKRQAKK